MCVQTQHQPWERPAVRSDISVLGKHFPHIDFDGMFDAMSVDGFQPLTTDLVLMAAMIETPADDLGSQYIPFAGLDAQRQVIVKIPEMHGIVPWFENTALGQDMWKAGSDWSERNYGSRVHFAMNCGCGLICVRAVKDGRWATWKQRFNASRHHVAGRTDIEERSGIEGTDITPAQRMMWRKMRQALMALPRVVLSAERLVRAV